MSSNWIGFYDYYRNYREAMHLNGVPWKETNADSLGDNDSAIIFLYPSRSESFNMLQLVPPPPQRIALAVCLAAFHWHPNHANAKTGTNKHLRENQLEVLVYLLSVSTS
jgi:hypothetical protein